MNLVLAMIPRHPGLGWLSKHFTRCVLPPITRLSIFLESNQVLGLPKQSVPFTTNPPVAIHFRPGLPELRSAAKRWNGPFPATSNTTLSLPPSPTHHGKSFHVWVALAYFSCKIVSSRKYRNETWFGRPLTWFRFSNILLNCNMFGFGYKLEIGYMGAKADCLSKCATQGVGQKASKSCQHPL